MIEVISKHKEVVIVPLIGFQNRRISLECFGSVDKVQAQKDAVALGHILKERIFDKKATTEPRVVKTL